MLLEIVNVRANSVHVKRKGKEEFPCTINVDDEEYIYGTWVTPTCDTAVYYRRTWMFS